MLLRHAIGSVLRRLRLQRGKTLRQLAEESRISLPYLSEIERGRKEASSEILAALCRVLDLTEEQLLREVGDEYSRAAEPATLHPVDAPSLLARSSAGIVSPLGLAA
ncbi:helix-turn-helix transcriptional regulator [Okibacterium endophyticum]